MNDLRADDARVACPLFQAEYGGSKPTSALQLAFSETSMKVFQVLNKQWHSKLPEATNCFEGLHFCASHANLYYAVAWWSKPISCTLNGLGWFELRRFAIADDAPKNTASRMLAWMVRYIRQRKPEITKLISYQDTSCHSGTIYKAVGWTPVDKGHRVRWGVGNGRKRNAIVADGKKIRWEMVI